MGNMLNKFVNLMGFETVEEDEFETMVEPDESKKDRAREEKVMKFSEIKSKNQRNQPVSTAAASYELEHIIIAPKAFEDARRIADEIRNKKMVTLNMSLVTFEEARRILDFVSGTAYAVDSRITKISDHVFISVSSKVKQTNELSGAPKEKEPDREILKEKDREKFEMSGYDEEEIRRVIAR